FYDDAVIFYLNGREIFRNINMPNGAITYTTRSLNQVAPECLFLVLSGTNVLMPPPATNVLAVELHESNGATDNEIYFGCSLSFTNTPLYIGPYFTNISPLPPSLS